MYVEKVTPSDWKPNPDFLDSINDSNKKLAKKFLSQFSKKLKSISFSKESLPQDFMDFGLI